MSEDSTRSRRPFPQVVPEEVLTHASNAREELRKGVAALMPALPAEFTAHRRAASREILLAIRSLIDTAIDRVDKPNVKAAE
jgi:hypothetical protein